MRRPAWAPLHRRGARPSNGGSSDHALRSTAGEMQATASCASVPPNPPCSSALLVEPLLPRSWNACGPWLMRARPVRGPACSAGRPVPEPRATRAAAPSARGPHHRPARLRARGAADQGQLPWFPNHFSICCEVIDTTFLFFSNSFLIFPHSLGIILVGLFNCGICLLFSGIDLGAPRPAGHNKNIEVPPHFSLIHPSSNQNLSPPGQQPCGWRADQVPPQAEPLQESSAKSCSQPRPECLSHRPALRPSRLARRRGGGRRRPPILQYTYRRCRLSIPLSDCRPLVPLRRSSGITEER